MIKTVIDSTKSRGSTGPDGISYHTTVHNNIPNIWKKGNIISILKPRKNPTEPSSYRPSSLMCNPIKTPERLILNTITPHIPPSLTQHGFRALRSTTTLLTTLTQYIHEGLDIPKPAHRTLLATTDISTAFYTVQRTLLIHKLFITNDKPIPYTNYPTTLGVTYDRGMMLGQHIQNINTRAKTRLNVLLAPTNTFFGHNKKTSLSYINSTSDPSSHAPREHKQRQSV